ncbi:twin-arginine translocase subunit TatC [Microbacterium indicum]|uniref:twin-arginine translocase subunit TatC n=1 Tax=Microbacterium indicum TaxID=358100 RepID=UPI00040AB43A|nr:twin-arginine translocase subunit TatC [Microbacterium indicum]
MTLSQHLRELRKRLTIAAIGLVVGMVISWFLTEGIITWLTYPIDEVADRLGDENFTRLTYTTVTGAFDMRLRISFVAGLVISSPVWLWQIWRFVTPGLTRKEFWYAFGFMAAAIPLFLGGVVLAIFLLPNMIVLMTSFVPDDIDGVAQMFTAPEYYNFVFRVLTLIGVGFVSPVFLVALNLADIVRAKAILKAWRWVLVVCLVFGMLASPPADMVTMFVVAGIMYVLYFLATGVALFFDWRKKKRNPDLFIEYA